MSKPDPAGGSLENILASIRKSLAEQPPDAPAQSQAPPPPANGQADAESASQRKDGLVQRLVLGDAAEQAEPRQDDLSDLLDDQPRDAGPDLLAPEPELILPAAPKPPGQDPLWFLSRQATAQPSAADDAPAAAAPVAPIESRGPPAAAAADPKSQRPDTLRASRPPFFGSPEAARQETIIAPEPVMPIPGFVLPPEHGPDPVLPVPPAVMAPAPMPPRATPATAAPKAAAAPPTMFPPPPAPSREALPMPPVPRAAEPPKRREAPPAAVVEPPTAPAAPVSALGDKPKPAPESDGLAAEADAFPAITGVPNTRTLEAMVVEMLQPMLRQWLDQNMPRLVAAALREQADRPNTPDRNGNKA